MAIRQGGLDCLCGVYAVINATQIVIGKFKVDKNRKKRPCQKRALFNDLVGYLAERNKLEKALTVGITKIDMRGGLLDIAIQSVRTYQQLEMRKQRAFNKGPVSLEQYWEKLTDHLSRDGTAVIIDISGRLEHWTCVKQITPETLILADSSGIKLIRRQQCTIGPVEKGNYTLWPMKTYLLSVENKPPYIGGVVKRQEAHFINTSDSMLGIRETS